MGNPKEQGENSCLDEITLLNSVNYLSTTEIQNILTTWPKTEVLADRKWATLAKVLVENLLEKPL